MEKCNRCPICGTPVQTQKTLDGGEAEGIRLCGKCKPSKDEVLVISPVVHHHIRFTKEEAKDLLKRQGLKIPRDRIVLAHLHTLVELSNEAMTTDQITEVEIWRGEIEELEEQIKDVEHARIRRPDWTKSTTGFVMGC